MAIWPAMGTEANFQSELPKLGLSPAGQALLLEKVAGRLEGYSGPGCPLPAGKRL